MEDEFEDKKKTFLNSPFSLVRFHSFLYRKGVILMFMAFRSYINV